MGFLSSRRMYLAFIVVAAAAVLVYSFMLKPPQEITGILWERSGGFAGLDETLTIGSDGSVALSSRFLGEAEFTLAEAEWEELGALIEDSGFMEFDAAYGAKAGVADHFSYSLTVEMDSTSKQVQWVDEWASEGDLPEGLEEIGERILDIIQGTGTGGVEGVVSDDSGNPLPGYSVSIIRGSAGFPEIAAITGTDGHYSIGGVPPGVFTLGVRGETGELLAEDTVFVRGGETSSLDFSVRGEILYDQSGGVGLFEEGIHIIATDGDPTAPGVMEGFEVRNDFWAMLRDASTLTPSTEDYVSVLISRGDHPTGGFQIRVEPFAWQESHPVVFRFEVTFTDPGEGVMVTGALTNPVALIPVGRLDPGLYIARVHIDRFIMTYDDAGNPVYDQVETLVEEVWETEFEVS
ncbi:carboxypeptidase regulatory-like domain-containing protein [Candidatus Bathyarchaeota archaeon]|nr:carboxypeptidase regulatory-like domain-containing protein [Candidatus Bathyarchaeota archaeon]MBL7080769.1 carboxypeptidase regulatory-like domain-containing protein [Candidatus Bathyarchaeota archaeon]